MSSANYYFHFQWDVARYQKQHSFVYEYGASLVDVAQPNPGERILDVGCGSGELTQALYERAQQEQQQLPSNDTFTTTPTPTVVMGMDADPGMIARATEAYPDVTFFRGDARNFRLTTTDNNGEDDDPRVDLVFSNAALHWVGPDGAESMVKSLVRAMKPGARLVVEFGGKGNVASIVQACSQVLLSGVADNFWYFPSIAEFTSLLERHGIEVTSAELFDRPTVLEEGSEGLKNWIRMFGSAFLKNTTPEQDEEALEKVCEMLRPVLFDGSQWIADYRRIRVVGRKLP